MSMITASVWVPRGAAANFPIKHDVDEKELARISRLAKLQLQDAEDDLILAQNTANGQPELDDSSDDDKPNSADVSNSQGWFITMHFSC